MGISAGVEAGQRCKGRGLQHSFQRFPSAPLWPHVAIKYAGEKVCHVFGIVYNVFYPFTIS